MQKHDNVVKEIRHNIFNEQTKKKKKEKIEQEALLACN